MAAVFIEVIENPPDGILTLWYNNKTSGMLTTNLWWLNDNLYLLMILIVPDGSNMFLKLHFRKVKLHGYQ